MFETIKKIVKWSPEFDQTVDLKSYIDTIRGKNPEVTMEELVALNPEPFYGPHKDLVLKYYPEALAVDDVWFALFPNGQCVDVEEDITVKEAVAEHEKTMFTRLCKIRDWDSDSDAIACLRAWISEYRMINPNVSIEEFCKFVRGDLFARKCKDVVQRYYPEALAVDNVWFVLLPDGEIRDVEYELRAAGRI